MSSGRTTVASKGTAASTTEKGSLPRGPRSVSDVTSASKLATAGRSSTKPPPAVRVGSATSVTSTRSTTARMTGWFTSLFSGTTTKDLKDQSLSSSIDDLEVLKQMKKKIIAVLDQQLNKKQAKSIKQSLSMIWSSEYEILKRRLRQRTIHEETAKRTLDNVTNLRTLSMRPPSSLDGASEMADEDSSDGMREAAMWILNDFTGSTALVNQPSGASRRILDSSDDEKDLLSPSDDEALDSIFSRMDSDVVSGPTGKTSYLSSSSAATAAAAKKKKKGPKRHSHTVGSSSGDGRISVGSSGGRKSAIAGPHAKGASKKSGSGRRGSVSRSRKYTSEATSLKLSDFQQKQTAGGGPKPEHPADRFRRVARRAMVVNAWKGILDDTRARNAEAAAATIKTDEAAGAKDGSAAGAAAADATAAGGTISMEIKDDNGSPVVGSGTASGGASPTSPRSKAKRTPTSPTAGRRGSEGDISRRTGPLFRSVSTGEGTAAAAATSSVPGSTMGLSSSTSMESSSAAGTDAISVESMMSSSAAAMVAKRNTSITELEVSKILSRVGCWDMDVLDLYEISAVQSKTLLLTLWKAMDIFNLTKFFDRHPQKFIRFVQSIESGYLDNPYHNKCHAADVVNNVAFFLRTPFYDKHTCEMDKFALLLSAAIHDVGHDGVNNGFHVLTQSTHAVTYNDKSVLENFHVSYAFQLLKKSQCDWFSKLPRPMRRYMRHVMIEMVLGTDMTFHNREMSLMGQLSDCVRLQYSKHGQNPEALVPDMISRPSSATVAGSSSSAAAVSTGPVTASSLTSRSPKAGSPVNPSRSITPSSSVSSASVGSDVLYNSLAEVPLQITATAAHKYDGLEGLHETPVPEVVVESKLPRISGAEDERLLAMKAMVHMCDISNPAKPIKVGRIWAEKIMTEFFMQGDKERSLGLPVSPMMDRNRSNLEQGQIGFIKFVVQPLFELFAGLIPEAELCLTEIKKNEQYWIKENEKRQRMRRRKRARTLPPKKLDELSDGQSLISKLKDRSGGGIDDCKDGDKAGGSGDGSADATTEKESTISDFKKAIAEQRSGETLERVSSLHGTSEDRSERQVQRELPDEIRQRARTQF